MGDRINDVSCDRGVAAPNGNGGGISSRKIGEILTIAFLGLVGWGGSTLITSQVIISGVKEQVRTLQELTRKNSEIVQKNSEKMAALKNQVEFFQQRHLDNEHARLDAEFRKQWDQILQILKKES